MQWIGYCLDVENFRKGISERKVRWILEWAEKHLASGYVSGKELKSALGRFCFVAGALPHVRPFLGVLFVWSPDKTPAPRCQRLSQSSLSRSRKR